MKGCSSALEEWRQRLKLPKMRKNLVLKPAAVQQSGDQKAKLQQQQQQRPNSEPTQRKDSFKLHTAPITGNHQPSPFLRRFRLPPLSSNHNASSSSYDDLMSPTCDGLGSDNTLYQNAMRWTTNTTGAAAWSTTTSNPSTKSPASGHQPPTHRRSGGLDSDKDLDQTGGGRYWTEIGTEPARYQNSTTTTTASTLQENARQKRQICSSDYFSMTDSMYSDCDMTEVPAPPSTQQIQLPINNFADVLKQISLETADIERRSREINESFPD